MCNLFARLDYVLHNYCKVQTICQYDDSTAYLPIYTILVAYYLFYCRLFGEDFCHLCIILVTCLVAKMYVYIDCCEHIMSFIGQ